MYDMRKYQAEALSTESPVDKDMQRMLVRVWEVPSELMWDMGVAGQQMDRVKRTVYYKKIDEGLMEELMPTHPTGEKRERIEQCCRLFHGICGIFTETGECCEEMTRFIDDGGVLNVENLKEEMGDLLWYINLVLATLGTNIVDVAEKNIAKLKARYPGHFDDKLAIERNIPAEQQALTGNPASTQNGTTVSDLMKLMRAYRRLQMTPIVDDEFPGIKYELDHLMADLQQKYGE